MAISDIAKTRAKLLMLAALFLVPIVLALILFTSGWRPVRTGNHGELIQPVRMLTATVMTDLDGKSVTIPNVNDRKWMLLYFATAECGKACEQSLYKMRQVHMAQGEDADRVRRVMIVTDNRAREWLHYVLKDYPGMTVLSADPQTIAAFARPFLIPPTTHVDALNGVYVVDPDGNFMMRYAVDADPTGMRKDLKHLLKLSRMG